MAGITAFILLGNTADRPTDNAPGTEGRLFLAQDDQILSRDNGTTWDEFPFGVGGGQVTATVFGAEFYQTVPAVAEFGGTDPSPDQPFGVLTGPSNIPAVDDEWSAGFSLAAGTYRMTVYGKKTPGGCIVDWYIDAVSQVTGQDWYADPEEFNTKVSDTVTVIGNGPHVLTLKITDHNASSSDYIWQVSAVTFQPTT